MDKLLAMKTFVQIVERGSLTGAAEAMEKSLPSVVRMLATLEETLDVRLLNRTTRRIALTDEGRRYLERCKQILADVDEAESELGAQQHEPSGRLTVTAPVMFGKMRVVPASTAFLQRYPRIEFELLLLDRTVNLIEEGIDVAVRIGHLGDSTMIAKKVGETRQVVCASPAYLDKNGVPQHPDELSEHDCIRFTGRGSSATWCFTENGKPLAVHVRGCFVCNQIPATIDACVEGLGVGLFFSYQVEHLVEQGQLVTILEEFELPALPINVVYSHAKLISVRVKAFVDWMAQALRSR